MVAHAATGDWLDLSHHRIPCLRESKVAAMHRGAGAAQRTALATHAPRSEVSPSGSVEA